MQGYAPSTIQDIYQLAEDGWELTIEQRNNPENMTDSGYIRAKKGGQTRNF